jgi:EAL domain-containing protein (putative c-di-GMP-specific phosphodiesterase class I)/GGDEF domain-containing protein
MVTQNLKRNSRIVYFLIIALGILLSVFVFISNQQVAKSTKTLVNEEFETLFSLQLLQSSLSEQERFLYEYYATQNRELFTKAFRAASGTTQSLLQELKKYEFLQQDVSELIKAQNMILELSVPFDANLKLPGTVADWDLAREHLEMFTMYRQDTNPVVDSINEKIDLRVASQYQQTIDNLQQTSTIVWVYSIIILVIAVIIGRYISNYIQISARSKRLALFPERNPNPIISLDDNNIITYTNPATDSLLHSLDISLRQLHEMLLPSINLKQDLICQTSGHHTSLELEVKDKIMSCSLHWLPDHHAWDLHLTDITERKLAEQKLNYQAFHRVESGLFNKNKFYADIDALSQRNEHFAIGTIEIRHYNQIVTNLGVEAALTIEKALAATLDELLQVSLQDHEYTFYHTSEKQFALIVRSDFCEVQMRKLVQKVEAKVQLKTFLNSTHIELDFGFCCYPEHGSNRVDLIKSINMALEKAITTEHSSLVIYSDELGQQVTKEIELTSLLRSAIDREELELFFQPQLCLRTNRIVGAETLIRWQRNGQFISPAEFIPLAERSGLIIPLGLWIMEQACFYAKHIIKIAGDQVVVAINISPQQFKYPSFLDMVKGVLALTQVPPQNIELEITEGVVMYNEQDTIDTLKQLKEMHLKLSIDDFGTGYSSLSYLKQFPIDKLKIDQSFIKHVEKNEADQVIVQAITDLGKNLGLTLIAEGVEEIEHIEFLKQCGCDEIQGYHFAKPMPKAEFEAFVTRHNQSEVKV